MKNRVLRGKYQRRGGWDIISHLRLKTWAIVTLTLAIAALVVRCIWQIVAIPTVNTMVLFIPFTVTLIGSNAFLSLLILNPGKLAGMPYKTGITVILTAGLFAGVTHFYRFIISPVADPFLSKVIGILVLLFGLSAFCILLRLTWTFRGTGDGQGK